MLNKIILIFFLFSILAVDVRSDEPKLYFGHDYNFRKMEFSESLGKNMLKDLSRHKTLYFGVSFTDLVGAEFGHGVTRFSPYHSTFQRGDIVNGQQICVRGRCNHSVYRSSGKITENYFDVILRTKPLDVDELRFMGSIGVSFNKIDIRRKLSDFGMLHFPKMKERRFADHKASLRLSTGFEYMIHDNIGFRNKIVWVNTRALRAAVTDYEMPDGLSSQEYAYKSRDSILYSLGVFAEF